MKLLGLIYNPVYRAEHPIKKIRRDSDIKSGHSLVFKARSARPLTAQNQ